MQTQIQKINEIVHKDNYKGVLISPNDSTVLIPYVKLLDDSGLPFIFLDTPLTDTPVTRNFKHDCGFVGTNNILAGKLAAEYIMEQMGKGTVVMIRGNHKHRSSIDRENGFLKTVSESTNFKTIGFTQGFWEEEKSYDAYYKFMKDNGERIDAVFAYSDPMAIGVNRYYKDNSNLKRPVIVGVDGTLVGQRAVLENEIDATVVQAPEVMAKIGLRNLVQCIEKKRYKKVKILTPVTLYTATVVLERASGE